MNKINKLKINKRIEELKSKKLRIDTVLSELKKIKTKMEGNNNIICVKNIKTKLIYKFNGQKEYEEFLLNKITYDNSVHYTLVQLLGTEIFIKTMKRDFVELSEDEYCEQVEKEMEKLYETKQA